MSLCIVVVRVNSLRNKNKSNDKERKKKSEKKTVFIYQINNVI